MVVDCKTANATSRNKRWRGGESMGNQFKLGRVLFGLRSINLGQLRHLCRRCGGLRRGDFVLPTAVKCVCVLGGAD